MRVRFQFSQGIACHSKGCKLQQQHTQCPGVKAPAVLQGQAAVEHGDSLQTQLAAAYSVLITCGRVDAVASGGCPFASVNSSPSRSVGSDDTSTWAAQHSTAQHDTAAHCNG